MERRLLVVVLAIGLPWSVSPEAGADPSETGENSCVQCHRRTDTIRSLPPWRQEQYLHWYGSIHGRKDVTCDKCHGGDATADAQDDAHEGVAPASDVKSRVYYKNLPQTCGSCHEEVETDFMQSRHFEKLASDQLAPSCTTCHGFQMAIGAVDPQQLVERCAICHNEDGGEHPEVAERTRRILDRIDEVKSRLQRTQTVFGVARDIGVPLKKSAVALIVARHELEKTGKLWHRFDLDAFEREIDGVRTAAEKAYQTALKEIERK